jgi:hypothetical protein
MQRLDIEVDYECYLEISKKSDDRRQYLLLETDFRNEVDETVQIFSWDNYILALRGYKLPESNTSHPPQTSPSTTVFPFNLKSF